jgi:signal transduction histidine kinase
MIDSKPSALAAPPTEPPVSGAASWTRLASLGYHSSVASLARFFEPLIQLLKIPPPDTAQILQRIEIMERRIILPIKIAGIAILLQSYYFSSWIGEVSKDLDVSDASSRAFFWVYVSLNVLYAISLLFLRRLPPAFSEWAVFAMSLVDGIFIGVLTLVTGGYNSTLYWFFLGLIVRSAVSVPRATSQLLLNLTLTTCYIFAGVIDSYIATNLDETTRRVLEIYAVDNPAEPLLLRLALLLLMTVGCYVVQVLLERQRQVQEEAREFAVREVQLQSAGRLAAEFAHQIKNPLAIINTASFSLQRAVKEARHDLAPQIQMIQEEVQRADRIITEVMGYAQLSEGHVERLNVLEELNEAIARVFPPAAQYPIRIHCRFGAGLPPLLMQRRHVTETLINVLQNAREALGEKGGNVYISARSHPDHSIEVSIRDDGPGIPKDRFGRVFEAYYTTKPKGTGLGLATVKHNVELYGGVVRVESTLGTGACFTLLFPAKTLMKLSKNR